MRVCRSRQDLTFQYPCSPLSKGEEGTGVGGIRPTRCFCKVWRGDWYYTDRAVEVHKFLRV